MYPQIKNFNLNFNGNIYFGAGVRKKIKLILNKNKWKNLCIIVDKNLKKISIINQFIISLKSYNLCIITCDIENIPVDEATNITITLDKRLITIYLNGKIIKTCNLKGNPIMKTQIRFFI